MRNSGMVVRAILAGLLAIAVVAVPGSDQVSGQGGAWTTKASMPARCCLAAGVVNGLLYVVGGSIETGYLSTIDAYDPAANAWTTKASMPTARNDLAVGVVNGILYAVGGNSDFSPPALNGFQSAVEAYDPATNTWTTKAPMPTPRWSLAAGAVNGVLYTLGGIPHLSAVESY